MDYKSEILAGLNNPESLENLFEKATKENKIKSFKSALLLCYEDNPDNLLLAAWFHRINKVIIQSEVKRKSSVHWRIAVPISILTGLIFWGISDFSLVYMDLIPLIALLWAPIASLGAILYISLVTGRNYRKHAVIGAIFLAIVIYVSLLSRGLIPTVQIGYLIMMVIHIPLISWIAIGLSILGSKSDENENFAFLIKSIEVMITAGVFLIAGVAFGLITTGLFVALNITFSDIVIRLISFGGIGLIPVWAVATVYDPTRSAANQDFSLGLSKFLATMMRLLLPLTMFVLTIYIFVIPFRFMEPFKNREVLIVYNILLFAVMGLLIGVTPISKRDLSTEFLNLLRRGFHYVITLTLLISVYAFSATLVRTIEGGMTMNRMTVLGWNFINIGLLIVMFVRLRRGEPIHWIESMKSVFHFGVKAYIVWGLFLVLGIPLLF